MSLTICWIDRIYMYPALGNFHLVYNCRSQNDHRLLVTSHDVVLTAIAAITKGHMKVNFNI